METVLRYRGRGLTVADIGEIRELIAAHPGASRRKLSERLCEQWGWRQAKGALRDMVARGLMLARNCSRPNAPASVVVRKNLSHAAARRYS